MIQPPDAAAFADAQQRLRAALGVDAVFLIPGTPTWPVGTALDPETGRPFDPFIEPDSSTDDTEVTVRCSFVHRPLDTADPAATPIGSFDRGSAALIVPVDAISDVRDATRVVVGEETWDIQLVRFDLSLQVPRYIAYLEHS